MPRTSRPPKALRGNPWARPAERLGLTEQQLSDFIRETSTTLGRIVPLTVSCAEGRSSRSRYKRRSPSFHPDPDEQSRPRKRTSRTPFFVPPTFDDETEQAIHESALDFCEGQLQLADCVTPRVIGHKRMPSEKLFLRLRLTPPPPNRDAESTAVRRMQTERERVPDAINIPKRRRGQGHSKVSSVAVAESPTVQDGFDERPATKIVSATYVPPPSRTDDVLPSDVPQSPKTPLEHILHFARGNTVVLAKIEKHEKKDALKKRTSLATFNGCGELSKVSLSAYLQALTSVHVDFIHAAMGKGKAAKFFRQGLDTIECDMSDEDLATFLSTDGRSTRRRQATLPPHIARTIDVVQLVFRLWQKMSAAEESLAQAFVQQWYSSGVMTAVFRLALEVLTLWYTSARAGEDGSLQRSELVEWCVRLLTTILIYELSPLSDVWGKVESGLVFRALTKDREPWLPKILDMFLHLVGCDDMAPGRECRMAVSELCQLYVVRHHCAFPKGTDQRTKWELMREKSGDHLETVIAHQTFWATAVSSAMQLVRKQEPSPDVMFAVAFLDSLLSEPIAAKSLVQKQSSQREALLWVLAKLLERLGRQLLSSFIEIERIRRAFPGLSSSVDLIRKLMSSAVLQRELISSRELELKKKYLGAITSILSRLTKFVPGELEDSKLMECARQGAFSSVADKLQKELPSDQEDAGLLPEVSDGEAEDPQSAKDCAVARHRALAFGAWLVGSLGKSMEDGSRDMTQMNGLQILVSSHFNSTRPLKKLWGILFKIQTGLEHHIPDDLVDHLEKPDQLLMEDDRNHFSMAVEAVRLRVVSEPKDRSARGTPENTPKQSSSEGETRTESKRNKDRISFPDVTRIKDLRRAVSTDTGYEVLDDDSHMLEHLEKTCKNRGEQVLARYDPDSKNATQWYRLQRKNVYLTGARDLLDKADKTLGQRCSCMPGHPTGRSGDAQMRIACSNNLCENRSTHMECVPDKCGAGSYCQNQRMQKMLYAKMKTTSFPGKGVGIVADEDIPAGSFIGEYQGEVISMELFENRKKEYQGERHFYFMTLTGKLVIDASRKSQSTRFVNHSCEPNAETQKWNAGGEPRVAIFAKRDIRRTEEITFDYGARSLANDTVPCLCGTKSCRGFLTISKKPGTGKDEDDEVMFDTSGFVKTADDMRKMPLLAKVGGHSTHTENETKEPSTTESEKLQESVQRKISRGKKDISLAEDITNRRKGLVNALNAFDESLLNDSVKKKLSDWEASMRRASRKPGNLFSLNDSSSKPETRMRIPRREVPRQESFLETYLRKEGEERNSSKACMSGRNGPAKSSAFPRKPPIHKPSSGPKPSPPSRPDSTLHQSWRSGAPNNGYRAQKPEEMKGVRRTLVDIQEAHAAKRSSPVEQKPLRRRGPIPAFLPTAPKVKKPLPKPKFAEKPKPDRDNSDDDSMDDYSVASSAEPIIEEEPPLSPSDLPDGLGACSDDEFVAAPPVGAAASRHREEERIDPRITTTEPGDGRDCLPRSNIDDEKTKPTAAASAEVAGERHRDNPDRAYCWPERDPKEGGRSHFEERGIKGGSPGRHDRDDAQALGRYRSRGPGPDNSRIASGGQPASGRDLQGRHLAGAVRMPHMPSDGNRRPEDRHEDFTDEPMRRAYHGNFPFRSMDGDWDDAARRRFDRVGPFTGSELDKARDGRDHSLRGRPRDDRGGHGAGPDIRDSGPPSDGRRDVRRSSGRQGPDVSHVVPPRRGDIWSDDMGRGAQPRRGDMWSDDGNHGVPPQRGDTWSDGVGRVPQPRRGDLRRDGVSPALHPRRRDMRSDDGGRRRPVSPGLPVRRRDMRGDEVGRGRPLSPGLPVRRMDIRGDDVGRGRLPSAGQPVRRRDMRGDDVGRGRPPSPGLPLRRRDMRSGDVGRGRPPSPGLLPSRRGMRGDDVNQRRPLRQGDTWNNEGMHRRYNHEAADQHLMNREPDSRHQRDRASSGYSQEAEHLPTTRFTYPDGHPRGSRESPHKLSGRKGSRRPDNLAPTNSEARRPDVRKDDGPVGHDRGSHLQVVKHSRITEEIGMPPSEKPSDALVDRAIRREEGLEPHGSEPRQDSKVADKDEEDGSLNKAHGAKQPDPRGEAKRQRHNQGVTRTQESEKSKPPVETESLPSSARPKSVSSKRSDASQVQEGIHKTEKRGASRFASATGVPEARKPGDSAPVLSSGRDGTSNVTPTARLVGAKRSRDHERDAISLPEKTASGNYLKDGRKSPLSMRGKEQKSTAEAHQDQLHENIKRDSGDGAKSHPHGSQGKLCRSSSAQLHDVRREGDASASTDVITEKEKPVMQRIGRRSGDGTGHGGNGNVAMEQIRKSRSGGGNFRSRHADGPSEHRRRSEGPNEHSRKRLRGDGGRSPRREGSHGSQMRRRRSGDMGSHRHGAGRNQRHPHSSERRDMGHAHGGKPNGNIGKQHSGYANTGVGQHQSAKGGGKSESSGDLRHLLGSRKKKGGN